MKAQSWAVHAFSVIALAGGTHAQSLHGEALVKALRQGGYVIVMRHTSSPRDAPSKQAANADNVKLERQLDEEGRTTATAFGKALRDLKIPIGDVLASPTYRALETVKYAQLKNPRTFDELGDNGQSMQGGTAAQAEWLRKKATELPTRGNTIIITHLPNLTGAFPQQAAGMADGESLVFGSDGKGGTTVVARIKIEEWPGMR